MWACERGRLVNAEPQNGEKSESGHGCVPGVVAVCIHFVFDTHIVGVRVAFFFYNMCMS